MKIPKSDLKKIIKEEIQAVMTENILQRVFGGKRAPRWLSDLVSDAYAPGESLIAAFEPKGGVELGFRPGASKKTKSITSKSAATAAIDDELSGTAYETPAAAIKKRTVQYTRNSGQNLSRALQKTLKAGGFLEGLLGLPYDVAASVNDFYDAMEKAGGLDKWDVESKVGVGKRKMSPEQAKRETQFWYNVGKRYGMNMDEPRTDVTPFQGRLYIAAGRGSRSAVRRIIGEMGLYNAREQLKLLKKQQQRNRGRLSKTGKLIKSEIENYLS